MKRVETVIILSLFGLALVFTEVFLPGMIAGTLGAVLLIAAIVDAYGELGMAGGNWTVLGIVIGLIGIWSWYMVSFDRTQMGRKMTLHAQVGGGNDSDGASATNPCALGDSGVTMTDLKPTGYVLIGSRRVLATSEGLWLKSGVPVTVVGTGGFEVRVAPVTTNEPMTASLG
jgi:membrane-bound serine protease (ClpP class)